MVGDQRLVVNGGDGELVLEALWISEEERIPALGPARLDAVLAKPLGPEVERVAGGDAPHDPMDHPVAGATALDPGVLEERQVRARVPLLVRVEQVINARVVLVDGLLDESQPEYPRIEVHVSLAVLGDRRDVVDAVELHDTDDTGAPCPSRTSSAVDLVPSGAAMGDTLAAPANDQSRGRNVGGDDEELIRDRSHADRRAHRARDGELSRAHSRVGREV